VVSLLPKLEFCGVVFGRLDKVLCDKLIKNSPFVGLQIRAGSLKQIAKDRNFQVREIIICHDAGPFLERFGQPSTQFPFQANVREKVDASWTRNSAPSRSPVSLARASRRKAVRARLPPFHAWQLIVRRLPGQTRHANLSPPGHRAI
jgi:hypothetical protein